MGRIRRARGMSRFAVLAVALLVAVLVAWLMLWRGAVAPDGSAAGSGTLPSADATRASAPNPAPADAPPRQPDAAASVSIAAATAASSGVDVTSNPGSPAAASGASSAPSSAPAGSNVGDAEGDAGAFPVYWRRCFRSPAAQDEYLIESDSSTAWSGSWSAKIASRTDAPRFPGAGMCQTLAASTMKGRRIRITLHMRTLGAVPGAHMLFRAEGADGRLLAFYNMEPRWVSGTSDWAEYSAVLDVPDQAAVVIFGGSLVNAGTLWIDDALIEFVGSDVGVTQRPPAGVHYNPVIDASNLSKALQNPGFEQVQPLAR